MFFRSTHSPRAFTLVELLAVIAIIGLLVSLLLPAVQSARESARRVQCGNNLRQIGVALQQYHESQGAFPHGGNHSSLTGQPRTRGGTWAALILPGLEQGGVFDRFDLPLHVADPANETAVTSVISTYICPSDSGAGSPIRTNTIQAGVSGFNSVRGMAMWYPGSMGPTADGCTNGDRYVFCPSGYDSETGSEDDFCPRNRAGGVSPPCTPHRPPEQYARRHPTQEVSIAAKWKPWLSHWRPSGKRPWMAFSTGSQKTPLSKIIARHVETWLAERSLGDRGIATGRGPRPRGAYRCRLVPAPLRLSTQPACASARVRDRRRVLQNRDG